LTHDNFTRGASLEATFYVKLIKQKKELREDMPASGTKKNENRRFTALYFITAAIILSAALAFALCHLVLFRVHATSSAGGSRAKRLLPEYKSGQEIYGAWHFVRKEHAADQNTDKLIFTTAQNTRLEIHISDLDLKRPCYKRTSCDNVSYSNRSGRISVSDDRILSRIISDISRKEKSAGCVRDGRRFTLEDSLRAIVFLFIAALIFDLFFWLCRPRIRGIVPQPDIAERSGHLLPVAWIPHLTFLGFIFYAMVAKVSWRFIEADGFYFFQGASSWNSMIYALGDHGMPAIPYRFIISALAHTDSFIAVQVLSLVCGMAAVFLTYALALRHVKPSLAWIAPFLLVLNNAFMASINELRGYSFFIMALMLAIYIYDTIPRRPHPFLFFAWVAAQWLAVASNPITVVVFAGFAIFYPFTVRRKLQPFARTFADLHFIVLAAGFAVLAPVASVAVGFHVKDSLNPVNDAIALNNLNTYEYIASASVLFFAAMFWRKENRAGIFFAASLGTVAMLALIRLHVLGNLDMYFLFVAPLTYIGWSMIAVSLVAALERYSRWRKCEILIAALVVIVVCSIYRASLSDLFDSQKHAEMRRNHEILRKTIRENRERLPVLILPKEAFFIYLIEDQKFNLFARNVVAAGDFHPVLLPTGVTVFRWRNYFTSYKPVASPSMLFDSPFIILTFRISHIRSVEPRNGFYGDSRCRLLRRDRYSFYSKWICAP
jgi:hypothetical protein